MSPQARSRIRRRTRHVAFDNFALEADAAHRDVVLRVAYAAWLVVSVAVTVVLLPASLGDSGTWESVLAGEAAVAALAVAVLFATDGLSPKWPERCEVERRETLCARARVAVDRTRMPHEVKGRYLYANLKDVPPRELRHRARRKTAAVTAVGLGAPGAYLAFALVHMALHLADGHMLLSLAVTAAYSLLLSVPWCAWCALAPPNQIPWREVRELAYRRRVPPAELWRTGADHASVPDVVRKMGGRDAVDV